MTIPVSGFVWQPGVICPDMPRAWSQTFEKLSPSSTPPSSGRSLELAESHARAMSHLAKYTPLQSLAASGAAPGRNKELLNEPPALGGSANS